jgi:YidC/Oxa1 family membrane protein insertase
VDPDGNEPYHIITTEGEGDAAARSFVTQRVRIEGYDKEGWRLDDVLWSLEESSPTRAVFGAVLRSRENPERALLRVHKVYELPHASSMLSMRLEFENPSQRDLVVGFVQDGPQGIHRENARWEMRRLFAAHREADDVVLKNVQRSSIVGKPDHTELLSPADADARFIWTALANKYFGVFTRPVDERGDTADTIRAVYGTIGTPPENTEAGDMVARLVSNPANVPAGGRVERMFEITASPKDEDVLKSIRPAFVGPALRYEALQDADTTCMCAFHPLPSVMKWLLETIYLLVRNYGVAIIVLVVIVRGVLHPLTVFQQKSMYRMQDSMGKIQPKMAAIKERYPNDKVKQNQETMKLWAEENVNPAAGMIGMVPMFIQMPILVALWTALNTDVHLRNAAFDGWWIDDLSRPDALIDFGPVGLTIPVLSWLPLVGSWFVGIPSLNLLPILMGASMWLQQKYMPKPGMQAKLEAAKKQSESGEKPKSGMNVQDQLRQQQMMMNIMSVMFPLMFYYMPSGLTLYWMATNVFGIFESLRIRKQIELEKKKGPRPPKRPGIVSGFFRRMAQQAEELQKKADEISR